MAYSFRICAYYLKSVFKSLQSKRNRQVKIFPNHNISTPEIIPYTKTLISRSTLLHHVQRVPSFGNTESSLNQILAFCTARMFLENPREQSILLT